MTALTLQELFRSLSFSAVVREYRQRTQTNSTKPLAFVHAFVPLVWYELEKRKCVSRRISQVRTSSSKILRYSVGDGARRIRTDTPLRHYPHPLPVAYLTTKITSHAFPKTHPRRDLKTVRELFGQQQQGHRRTGKKKLPRKKSKRNKRAGKKKCVHVETCPQTILFRSTSFFFRDTITRNRKEKKKE